MSSEIFYEKLPLNIFKEYAITVGLNTYCDLKIIKEYILKSHSILDVGSGYGRVLEYLISLKLNAKITSIERSKSLQQFLKKRFSDKFTFIDIDLREVKFREQYDLILWMWSGIEDFSAAEQFHIVKKLYAHLEPNGLLVIDTVPPLIVENLLAGEDKSEYITVKEQDLEITCYYPSIQLMKSYASKLNRCDIQHKEYKTTTNKQRLLHFLFKK